MDLKVIEKEKNTLVAQANNLVLKDQETYEKAAEFKIAARDLKKQINEAFDDGIKEAHDHHKSLVAKKKVYYGPVDEAERIVGRKCKDYERQKEKERLAEEEKAREERERKAEEAIEAGQDGEAESILEEPAVVPEKIDRVKGLGSRDNWKFKVVDISKIPAKYLKVDEVKIGQVVRALKKDHGITGIEVWCD